jgi:quercetin dioxygenase-like cupin family protein
VTGSSRFILSSDIPQERFEWGTVDWRLTPADGAEHLVVMDVSVDPGQGHAFHRHPGQEEMIIVTAGRITQFLEQEARQLGPGDSVFIAEGVIHASFNDGTETVKLQVVISPTLGVGTGYDTEDVSTEEPWASLRIEGQGA